MNASYSYSHFADHALKPALSGFLKSERGSLVDGLAVMAEIDVRRLYAAAAYPSMVRYLVGEHELEIDEAYLRVRVARTAHEYPVIFPMLANGALCMTSVVLLTPRLTPDNAAVLLAAAAKKTKAEIAELLAGRFPQPDQPTMVRAVGGGPVAATRAPAPGSAGRN